MSELSDAIKDYEEEDEKADEMKHPPAAEQLKVHAEIDEFLEAGPGEQIEPQSNKQEDQLLIDMKKLVGLDSMIAIQEGENEDIWAEIIAFQVSKGYDKELSKLDANIKDLRKQYNLLKADIGKRAEENYENTKNVDPCLGVKVTMRKNRELTVDWDEGIAWCVENNYPALLSLNTAAYGDQLTLGTIKNMPGKVNNDKIPKARISLNPFQEEEK